MKVQITISLLIAVFLIGVINTSFSQTPEQLYQKGLIKEEGEGALNEAIDIYNKIVENQDADKSLRAKALLHIGMCYEKQGTIEATKTYRKLLNKFPGQKDEVVIARERLSRLIQKDKSGTVKRQEGIRIRQLWKIPYQDALGTVTSDGQFRSGCDWGNGDLAIHNLITGKIRLLTNNAGKKGFALESAISKNDKQVAYSWWEPGQKSDLLLTDVNNPTPSVIYSVKEETVYPATWLSDKVLIVTRINTETSIADICSFNISDKTIQSMKTFEMRKWPQIATSPDEKFIAYDFANESHGGTFDINILLLDGKSEITLIEHPANDRVLGWMPGRKEFLFISDRSGSWDLWAILLEDGETIGMARLVYSDIGEVKPMGFAQNGDCFFGFSRLNFNNYIVPFDTETGDLNLESGKSLSGSGYWLDWSPDGLNLIQGDEIVDLRTSAYRKITDGLSMIISPQWSPDGTKILFVGIDKSRNSQVGYKGDIYIVDAQTGQIIELFPLSDYNYKLPDDDAFPLSDLQWSLDGKRFFYLFFKDRLVKHYLETGEDEIIYKQSHFDMGVLSRSPDGKKLLFAARSSEQKKSRLYIIPVEGGKEIELCTPQVGDNFGMSFWSPDGKSIFFSEGSMDGTSLWRIPSEGGVPEKVWYSDKRVEVFKIRPDGKQLAITIRERTTVVKVIEGLVDELEK